MFGRNREQLIYLPIELRNKVRKFVTDCAIRRAEIGNNLTTFDNQWAFADQMEAQGQGPGSQRVRDDAIKGPLEAARKALDALVVQVSSSATLVNEINATT